MEYAINTENKNEKIFVLLDIDIKHVSLATECEQCEIWRLIGTEITVKELVKFLQCFDDYLF